MKKLSDEAVRLTPKNIAKLLGNGAEAARHEQYLNVIKRLLVTCGEWGLKVSLVKCTDRRFIGWCEPEKKTIFLASRLPIRTLAHVLLHEMGHCFTDEETLNTRLARAQGSKHIIYERTLAGRISILEEEFEAWWHGERLARQMKLKLNWPLFERHKARYVLQYIDHAWATTARRRALKDLRLRFGIF